jgi:hypothetical protein
LGYRKNSNKVSVSDISLSSHQMEQGYQRQKRDVADEDVGNSCVGFLLTIISYLIVICTFPLSLCFTIKVVQVRFLPLYAFNRWSTIRQSFV